MANVSKIFEGRARSTSRQLSAVVDGEGNETEVDIREDEEQNVKLQQCIDLLLAAGYFRARIKGLSPFDKIVGGMTWCVTSCNVDIDINLLFQENSTIGQKIALTERIVRILPKMKCPHRIEPHQIQGLDFIHIYPVMQWLVKRAMETRAETGDYIRSFSISQFRKNHSMPAELAKDALKLKAMESVKSVKNSYRPQRRYRHHDPGSIKDREIRVQTTLLEYGRQYGVSQPQQSEVSEKFQKKMTSESSAAKSNDQSEAQTEEDKRIKSLMSGMSEMSGQQVKLTVSAVGSLVGMQSQQIQQIATHYSQKQAEIEQLEKSERVGSVQQHKRVAAALHKQIQHNTRIYEQLFNDHAVLQTGYRELQHTLQKLKLERGGIDEELAEVTNFEKESSHGALGVLQGLVTMNESLRKQEQEFKAHCKEEMARLNDMIRGVQEGESESSQEERERAGAIDRQHEADREKLHKLRLLLAKKNREISTLQRKIDEVPTRAELNQYQKRFIELYNQISTKHTETKQFYTLYNTLDDKKLYLNKEVSLLNSVYDNFVQGMSSASSKEQFLKQFESIVDGVIQNKMKTEKKKQIEKARRDGLKDEYLRLIDEQRLYFKTVKDFKQECHKNEVLLTKLRES